MASSYARLNNPCYDPEFDALIRARQPSWFEDTTRAKKDALLAMPVGCKRPHQKIVPALCAYTRPASECYDPDFDLLIRARQPSWFEDTARANNHALLAMPVGSKRPISQTSIGCALGNYTRLGKCYDPEFAAAIRARQPSWFRT